MGVHHERALHHQATNTLVALSAAASQVGDEVTLELTRTLATGLRFGKAFLKAHQERSKSHHKHAKMVLLREHLDSWVAFLNSQSLVRAPSLRLLRAKVSFFAGQEKQEGLRLMSALFTKF